MTSTNNFMGKGQFIWWTGVVEDRFDPHNLGRVRVRCLGFHSQNKDDLPTKDLPWAQVILPVTSAGISGIGHSPSFLPQGTWCVGYFRDGESAQEPIVFGVLPGNVTDLPPCRWTWDTDKHWVDKGFYDPNADYPWEKEIDTNRLAYNSAYRVKTDAGFDSSTQHDNGNIWGFQPEREHKSLSERKLARIVNIPTADFDLTTAADETEILASDSTVWSQINPQEYDDKGLSVGIYNAVYPFNKVFESEGGHIFETDDSPFAKRIHERHVSGTSYEIDNHGNKTNIIVGRQYTLALNDDNTFIAGASNTTIDGHHKLYIKKSGQENNNYDIQVGANANINVQVDTGNINLITKQGKINVNSGGDYNVKVGGNMNLVVQGNKNETVEGSKTSDTSGPVIHRGSTIDLNP